jgi:Ca-activated chloride channel homolog
MMNSNRVFALILAGAACLGTAAPCCASERVTAALADRTLSPFFHVRSEPTTGLHGDPFPLKDTHVEVTIAGVIAEVSVTQTYANEGTRPLEAAYVFPGSTRAAVHGLTMFVGDRVVRAQIQTKRAARDTYERAKSEGKTASLLEQQRPNVFHMSLANVLPGETVRVELRYTELLLAREREYEFVFPTVVAPRYSNRSLGDEVLTLNDALGAKHVENAGPDAPTFGLKVQLAAGVPLADVSSATHDIVVDGANTGLARIALNPVADPASHANRDFILHYRLAGDAVQSGLLLTGAGTPESPGYFLAMIQPPARPAVAATPPRDYVFVVDVSGSMNGFPLKTAKVLLTELLSDLEADDSFNVVLFAGGSRALGDAPLIATPENLAAAVVLLDHERSGGGTELLPALERAMLLLPKRESAARTVVVVTDGFVTIEANSFQLVRNHLGHANVFTFGIGSSVNRHLIESLARAGFGEPWVVTNAAEAPAAADRFRRAIASPVLANVQVAFENVATTDVTPAGVPDVFAERPVVLFGHWQGHGGSIRLSGTNAAGPFAAVHRFADAVTLPQSRALELLWARQHISDLEDLAACSPSNPRSEAITELGLKHGLLTKYTSFVAVDEVVRTTPGTVPSQAVQPLAVPANSDPAAISEPVPTTPEPGVVGLLALSAGALAWARWRKRRERVAA